MTRIECNPSDIYEIIKAMQKADSSVQEIVENLDRTVAEKGKSWSGDSEEYFIRFFREWRRSIAVQSAVMKKVIEQLGKMADGYQKVPD